MLYQALSGPLGTQTHCGPSEPAANTHESPFPCILLLLASACTSALCKASCACTLGRRAANAVSRSAGGLSSVELSWATPKCGSSGRFVSLDDAERTIKTGQPPEMRMEVSATATAPQPAKAAVAAAAAAEPARAAPARPGAPQQNGPAAEPSKVLINTSQHSTVMLWCSKHSRVAYCHKMITIAPYSCLCQ